MINVVEFVGYVAAFLNACTFYMRTMTWLRYLAIASNCAWLTFGWITWIPYILVLHSVLLPLNIYRLREMLRMVGRIRTAARGEVPVDTLLPFMTRRRVEAGEVLFRRGAPADRLFYISSGIVRVEEIGVDLGPGDVFGEIGLFVPERTRTSSAVCREPGEIFSMSADDVARLYYQNPEFGFFIIRLATKRLVENVQRLEATLAARPPVLKPGIP